MSETGPKRMSLAEFLDWDDGTDTRYELIAGVAVPMALPTIAHGTIVTNIGGELRSRLRSPCHAIAGAGIVPPDRSDSYLQADIVVTCAPGSADEPFIPDPVVIIEVLSPSTAAHDRGLKLAAYRQFTSVQEILLVSSEDRRVEFWRRAGPRWIVEDLIGEATVRLESVGVEIPLAAMYQDVALA